MTWDKEEDKNVKKGPWGAKKPEKPSNSGNSGTNQGKSSASEVEEILRQAQSSFGTMFGDKKSASQNHTGGSERGLFGIVAVTVLALWLGTGLYRVLPEENAVILTFGKWTATKGDPGLGYRLPWPIQDVLKVNVAFDRRIEIGFRDKTGDDGSRYSRNSEDAADLLSESQMLTGDENIVDIDFVVMWNISNAKNYLFEIRDPEMTIKKVAESAMREIIGQNKIQSALTEGRADIEGKAKSLMQKMLDEYQSGVVINNVQLLRVAPPEPVVDAFDDVQRARADKERAANEGEAYQNDIVPKARGEAQKILQDAEAYKGAVVNKAKGDASRFDSVYAAYKQSEDVTKKRLYIETMQEIMRSSKKFILDGSGSGSPVVPYLSLEQIKKQ